MAMVFKVGALVSAVVSMVKLSLVLPVPLLPARSVKVLLATVKVLVASLVFSLGVKVAVQVLPLSLLATSDKLPLLCGVAILALLKFIIFSLKVKVTKVV